MTAEKLQVSILFNQESYEYALTDEQKEKLSILLKKNLELIKGDKKPLLEIEDGKLCANCPFDMVASVNDLEQLFSKIATTIESAQISADLFNPNKEKGVLLKFCRGKLDQKNLYEE